ncbi:ABC transporter permease [Undibacterium oligocarboniphilum]|uniref:ABC transporter permease n=1 Tax=Undibacterium oligocarboniphilum TaxID=666702 RepID=A0A850QGG9_9BURK|nr:ABC transporter permease [Undibacterium oligocarboniphilum]MBC3870528.1 ABC transporter permease [Undibacterium oligocarboniphilum]NVO78671.1 ABC transporter permease [Undibacterium oligocarboniphilum]
MHAILSIFRKEIKDALRDRRTLMTALISSLLGVPLMLLIFSIVLSQVESQEEKRTVLAVGMEYAPRLENFILRQGYQVKAAPADYEAKSRSKELDQPVLLVPTDFERKLQHGEKVTLEVAYDTNNRPAEFGLRPLKRLLEAYTQETAVMELTMRGVSAELLQLIDIKERHLQKPDQRKASITEMLPMMVLMAIVIGGMYAAIDTTAGERERGSLEPLMMNPVSGWQLTIGKWSAVALVGMGVVMLTIFSFFPSQWLIKNDTLRAEFQFGIRDAMAFLLILLPLAASMAALQVAVALDCKSYKEAQVRNQIVTMFIPFVSLIPIAFPGREPAWFRWVPVLAQNQMMNQVLKGELLSPASLGIASVICLAITLICLTYIAQKMRQVVMS